MSRRGVIASALRVAAFALVTGVSLVAGVVSNAATPSAEAVVLLHGLGRSERAMRPLAADLAEAGYTVCNIGYPSRSATPEALVADIADKIDACNLGSAARLNFVGHSLGGILTRAVIASSRPANLGRVVMLAPPNHGSEYVDLLHRYALFRWIIGPTGTELGTDAASLPQRLPAPSYEIGVIAGTWSMNPFAGLMFHGQNDGLVSVESTKLAGMTDFLTVAHSHTFIMRADDVSAAVIHFFRYGRFK